MKLLSYFLGITLLLNVTACGDKKDPNLEEAGKIHNEAHEIGEAIEPQIEALDSLKNVLLEKKKTLTDAAALAKIDSTTAAFEAVQQAFETWEDNIVSVPGMEHNHDHAAGEAHAHEHDHKPAPDVTSEQMLEIQKEMKTNIEKIKADLAKAEEMLKKVM
jgi:ABC-type nickel/cobalt efflux system permease component RcnA